MRSEGGKKEKQEVRVPDGAGLAVSCQLFAIAQGVGSRPEPSPLISNPSNRGIRRVWPTRTEETQKPKTNRPLFGLALNPPPLPSPLSSSPKPKSGREESLLLDYGIPLSCPIVSCPRLASLRRLCFIRPSVPRGKGGRRSRPPSIPGTRHSGVAPGDTRHDTTRLDTTRHDSTRGCPGRNP